MSDLVQFISDFFGIAKNTSATIFITLLVFTTGQLLNYFTNSIKRTRIRFSQRKIFKQVLKASIRTARKQMAISEEVIDLMNFEKISKISRKRMEFYQFQILKEIGFREFHKAFFQGFESIRFPATNKLRVRTFSKCWEIMKGLEFWVQENYHQIDEFGKKYNLNNEIRNNSLKQLRFFSENLMQFARQFDGQKIDAELGSFLTGYFDIHTKFQKKQNLAPRDVHRNLIIPLRIHARKHPSIKYIPELNNYLLEASLAYENMYNAMKKAREQYFIYSSNFRYYYRTLEKTLKIM
ncbi:hypothetical protein [Ekhidna sp.]|uniref:hypothetical protein n=1 Tax=Ekhidna sp. TaxID=2608089 RepID=UPI003CCC2C3E